MTILEQASQLPSTARFSSIYDPIEVIVRRDRSVATRLPTLPPVGTPIVVPVLNYYMNHSTDVIHKTIHPPIVIQIKDLQ